MDMLCSKLVMNNFFDYYLLFCDNPNLITIHFHSILYTKFKLIKTNLEVKQLYQNNHNTCLGILFSF